MDQLGQDLRIAWRSLRRTPGLSLAIILTLTLGIGAGTTLVTLIRDVLLAPLPVPESERLVSLCETHPSVEGYCVASPPNVADWQRLSRTVSSFGQGRDWPFLWRTSEGVERLRGGLATPGFLTTLGVRPELGRLLEPRDQVGSGQPVVVLSYALWKNRFGGAGDVLGSQMLLDGISHTVIGVLAQEVPLPSLKDTELWRPFHFDPTDDARRNWRGFVTVGRLAPGSTLDEARSELLAVRESLAVRYPETNEEWGLVVSPLIDRVVGDVRALFWTFAIAVGLLLLIGCANIANLLLVRSISRSGELAVRASLGARPLRLIRQLLTENALLAVLGGFAGAGLSVLLTRLFLRLAPPSIPRLDQVEADRGVLAVALALAGLTALLFGVIPAWRASRQPPAGALSTNSRTASGNESLRQLLVVAQIALAITLLCAAGLLARSLLEQSRWHPAIPPDRLMAVALLSGEERFETGLQVVEHHGAARELVASLPGVVSAGMTSAGDLFGGVERDALFIEGRDDGLEEPPAIRWYDVDRHYFSTVDRRVLEGRGFETRDREGSVPVAVVNQTAARRFWGSNSPLGSRATVGEREVEIVGVVEDPVPFPPGAPTEPEIFWPNRQQPRWGNYLVVRTTDSPAGLVPAVRTALRQFDPELQASFRPLDTVLDRALVTPRFHVALIGLFAVSAAALASIGTSALLAFAVTSRRRELAIRLALGARPEALSRSVVGQGLRLFAVGCALGLLGAFAISGILRGFLHGISPWDPGSLAAAVLLFLSLTLAASLVPARRVARLVLTEALRQQ